MTRYLLLVASHGSYPFHWDRPPEKGGMWSTWTAGKYISGDMTLMTLDSETELDARAMLRERYIWNHGSDHPIAYPDIDTGCWRVADEIPVDALALRSEEMDRFQAMRDAAIEAKERETLAELKAKYERNLAEVK